MLAGCSAQDKEQGPVVLAAASLQEAMEAAADEWTAQGHVRPVLSFAASSALARQVETGAAGDLFISADEKWMDEVAAKGLIFPNSKSAFLTNSMVLVAPAASEPAIEITHGFPLDEALGDGRLAMADPDSVPAGRYGKQAMVSLGVWDSVKNRIASADNVRVALALVSRGEAPLGVVYATDAMADPGVRVVGRFPDDSHAPIRYPLARLKVSANPDAEAFRRFLVSDEGKAVFRRFGFGVT